MGKPIIWSGVNAKLINSGDLIDSKNNSLTNGDKITVTQASHGFTSSDVGRPLYLVGGTWTLAIASAAASAEVAGFIYAVLDANTLRISTSGQCPSVGANFLDGGGSLVAGEVYFLSPSTAGKVTATEPTVIGEISKPLGVATSTTSFQFFNFRGSVVGGANARTQISLSNNTTANVQDVSAYDAGEIVGWVFIDATTDYRFLLKAQFAKTGAGTNWNLSYQTVGDTPPAGFSFSITSAGVIRYTMPSVTGFSSALFNYALNAPAVGTSFPLSVSGTSVVGGTPTVNTINESTLNNGVQIQGRKSGSAISSGYVGELKFSRVSSATNLTSNIYNDVASISLGAGIWLLTGQVILSRNAATFTSIDIDAGFGALSGNVGPAISSHYDIATISTSFTRFPITATPTVVRCDGTNIFRDDGASYSSTTIYLKCYPGAISAGTSQFLPGTFINAIRIA